MSDATHYFAVKCPHGSVYAAVSDRGDVVAAECLAEELRSVPGATFERRERGRVCKFEHCKCFDDAAGEAS